MNEIEALEFMLWFFIALMGVALIFAVILYIFESIGLYTIAKRRGLKHPWFAWVPICSSYLTGSISDQYQYLVFNKNTNKRKILLGLSIASIILGSINLTILTPIFTTNTISNSISNLDPYDFYEPTNEIMVLSMLASFLNMVQGGITIASLIIGMTAIYDIFRSCKPDSAVVYLICSIIFPILLPFFIFADRKKDIGMPPRKQTAEIFHCSNVGQS